MLAAKAVLLLTMLLTFSLHRITAHFTPTECCFKYAQKPIRQMQSFYETPRECSMPAVVIVAGHGSEICADPKMSWVKKAMKKLRRKK
ncbi:PREDICTED: C-C motif chemokine 3-like [Tauraco erythrolophus]|uniref:C-C motif chemokine 3-like n=1 Tax=Tauraco erythrolophus TaxID=121530 RepID=UPI0005237A76|nr:PREDICTED: C-C motif chemokine 3-like [Tauraco erythrolophus]